MALHEWLLLAVVGIFALVAGAVLWQLNSGQIVGSVKGPWFMNFGRGTGRARILVRRQDVEKAEWPTVTMQVRAAGKVQGYSFTPRETAELATLLDEAARKVDPR